MKSFASFLATIAAAGLLVAGSQSSPSQTSKPVSLVVTDSTAGAARGEESLVRASLDEFDSALVARDIDRLQAVGIKPSTAKRWQKFFKSNPEAQVTDDCPVWTLIISGDDASWNCRETATIISEGKPVSFEHMIRFIFEKTNGVWMIVDRK